MHRSLDKFKERHPNVRVDTYIDDITLSVVAYTDEEVEAILVHAGHDLHQVIQLELKCAVAKDKTVLVSRSDALATAISRKLGCLGAISVPATIDPGIAGNAQPAKPLVSARAGLRRASAASLGFETSRHLWAG